MRQGLIRCLWYRLIRRDSSMSTDTLSAIYPVLKRLSRRFSFVPINPPINSLGACIPSEVDYRPLPGISASALSWQQDRRPATADYLTSSSRAAGPHQRHAQGDRGGYAWYWGGCLCMAIYPSLGRRKFFQELDSTGASTKATAGQRPGGYVRQAGPTDQGTRRQRPRKRTGGAGSIGIAAVSTMRLPSREATGGLFQRQASHDGKARNASGAI